MTELNQSYLTDRSESTVTVQTTGTVIRPVVFIASAFVDEARWQFEEDGLRVTANDPANVALFDVKIPASAFGRYDVDGSEVGLAHADLRRTLNMARHGEGTRDPVRIDVQDGQATVSVERAFNDTDVDHRQTFFTLETDSIRETPDLPDLDLPNSAAVDTKAFKQVVDAIADDMDYEIRGEDGLVFRAVSQADTDRASYTAFDSDGAVENPDATSVLGSHYLGDIADVLHRAHIDAVTVEWSEQVPVVFEFERRIDEDLVLDGSIMVAPKIKSE